MSSRHWLLRVPEDFAADAGWSWVNAADPEAVIGMGSLAEFAAAVAGLPRQPVVALLPVARVLAVPVSVPQRQQRQLLAALPFLLEETLASDIERFHVIAGVRIDTQRLQAIAIERETFAAALAGLQSAGIDPDIIGVDALALPGSTLFLDGARSLLRTADGNALAFDARDAAVIAAQLVIPEEASLQVFCGPAGGEALARAVETELATRDTPARVAVADTPRDLLAILAGLSPVDWTRTPNLRQGVYAKRGSGEFSLGFDWRPLAWLAACWAVVALGYQLAVGVSYSRAAEATQAAQVTLYKQLFPGSANVPRPRQQMEGQLGNGGDTGGLFVSLVARTSDAFAELGGADAGFRPGNLAWDGSQKQLRVDVVARSLEDLDKLRMALEQKGLLVDIGAGIAHEGGYKARINVGEGA